MTRTYRLIWEILSPREQQHFLLLFVLALIMAVFELLGVAMILPFLQVLADPGAIQTNAALRWIQDIFEFSSLRNFALALGGATFGVILFSMAFRAFATYALTRFSLMRAYTLSSRLLRGYLHQNYVWFLSRNSADLGQTLLSEIDTLVRECILPAVLLVSNIFVTTLIIGFLFVLEPWIAISAFLALGSVYAAVYLGLRRFITRIGKQRFAANKERFHIAQEATGGIKELKVMGLEDRFLAKFRAPALRMARYQTQGLTISKLPRFALEAVTYGGFILMTLVLVVLPGTDIADVIPIFGLIGMAATKLFPALQQIYLQTTMIRFSMPALEKVHHSITTLTVPDAPNGEPAALTLADTLELRDIRFRYPGADQDTLRRFSMKIPAFSTIGIVGGTGAGKTTVIDLILGLLDPDSGQLLVDGQQIDARTKRAWQKNIGYVPQQIFLSDDSVAANIAFGIEPDNVDMNAVERAARIANLHDFVTSELPEGYATRVGERGVRLSGGQRQRIGIARALYHDPGVLILDEATSALDNLTERAVMEAVHNLDNAKTIIMIAHRLTTVESCDTIFLLEKGVVVAQGKYHELVQDSEAFRSMALG